MISYYSTFITGFGAVVKSALINSLKNVKVELLADGLIVYKTSSSPNAIQKIKFLNNSFVLLKKVDNLTADPINDMMQIFLYEHKIENYIRRSIKGKRVKFRIRASIKNQFVSIDKEVLKKLENDLNKKLRTRDDKVVVNRVDAYDLKDFKEDSISKIVTDPPWGLYNAKNFDVNKYYSMMLQEFCRIVRPKGLVVILTAQKELLETIHLKFVELELMEKYNTL